MISSLKNVATADGYSAAATLTCPNTTAVDLVIGNAAIYWQRGVGSPPAWLDDESYLPPTVGSIDVELDAIRLRSATPGTPAQVSITAYQGTAAGGGDG